MKTLFVIMLATTVIALAVLVTSFALRGASAWTPVCGPGAHWVDACGAGTDVMDPTGAVVGIDDPTDGNLDCQVDQTLVVGGPTDVDRQASSDDSANFPGTRPVDVHMDVIDTEIVDMELTGGGITLRAGVNNPSIDPAVPNSYGAIAELPGDTAKAESFFDVFFEVSGIPVVGTVYNHADSPLRVSTAEIDYVPPDTIYHHPAPMCIALYDDPVAGSQVANLVTAEHNTQENVGGIAGFPDVEEPVVGAAEPSGDSSFPYAALAGGLAAAVVVLAVGGWYMRRRWLG